MKKISHLKAVNESYFTHMKHAFKYMFQLAYATFAVAVHAFFPFLHQTTASQIAYKVYNSVDDRKNK